MKQILLFFIVFFSSITLFGQAKRVAMLEPIASSEGVSLMVKNMVRGELTKSLSKEPGFDAFTRIDIDKMMKEFKFQESGMVNDEQRLKLGQMSGADYVCISKITKDDKSYYLEAFLVHLESGKIDNPASAFVEGGYAFVNSACQKIAAEMVGKKLANKIPPTRQVAVSHSTYSAPKKKTPVKSKFKVYDVSVNFKNHKIMVIDRDFTEKMTRDNAVRACRNLNYGGFNDWRLPTKEEMKVMFKNRYDLSGLEQRECYWYNAKGKIWVHFPMRDTWSASYDHHKYKVRCVRTVN
ncbi:DUF1566 domain-containing protein [Marinifilum flexuosum]|uniref:Peptidoglycan-synthase activator LpoB n=1 Tax=Marinifilum flexuosum TaxID=1117708 RepID=A0A419X778_9BACT|nr:DUF1566 domain-containing protein [Marinifilum flexuosum]RKE03420.1 peptidoglycan-synthase activator LpoB [Marinifilum flexuosum]